VSPQSRHFSNAIALRRRRIDSVEGAPLDNSRRDPGVDNRHPAKDFRKPRALGQSESHQAADHRASNERSGHIPVLNADFFGRNQQRAIRV